MIPPKTKFFYILVCLCALYAIPAAAQPAELFISEYIEGSSNNKAIEIYNGTGAAVNLAAGGYNIQMFFNGNPLATLTINLTGTVAAGDVYVVAQSSAGAAIIAQADQTNGSGWFNGDDAVVLRKGTAIIDSIGQAGLDPGTEWGTGLVSTADNTLRRKASVTAGDTTATNPFDPAIEWDGFANDTFNGLGAHLTPLLSCGPTLSVPQGTVGTRVVTAADPNGTVTSLLINSVTPPPAVGAITMSGVVPASTIGGTASATITAGATVPVGSYSVQVTAANNDATPQSDTCTLTVSVVSVTTLEIWAIQSNGAASPVNGQVVRTENNIVTALGYSGGGANGFFIQTPDARADGTDQTSNGIFVFTGGAPGVSAGDQVDITATVTEFFTMTELTSATVTVDSTGNALPAAVLLTQIAPGVFVPSHDQPWPPNELERFEGMLVRVENGRVTGPTDQFGDAAIVADSTRAFREPGIEFPGDPAHPVVWDGNPEIFEINPDGAGLANVALAAGTVIDVAEGPLGFSFGDYQIWPTTLTTSPATPLPRAVRARNPGEFTVASQNMLRLFDTSAAGRFAKASQHFRTVLGAPDVLVLEEVENIEVLNTLVAQIAADAPGLTYSPYLLEGNDIGGIDIGFLVRDTISVTAVTQLGKDTPFETGKLNDRPPLVLQGDYVGNGASFPITVIGVHARSLIDIETLTRVREKRLQQALQLADYVQSLQTGDASRRIVVTGDFNAFQFSDGFVDVMGLITGNLDPDGAIHPGHEDRVEPDLTNHVNALPAAEQYSYVFEGSAQVLDHMLTSSNLAAFVRTFQYARGNADAPESLQNDFSTPLALSDHDGAVLFVMTDFDGDGSPDDVDNCSINPNPGQQDFDADGIGDSCDDDDDNDGVLDGVDACQQSAPLGIFVVVDACTTTVPDQLLITGCSITESIAAIANASWNHGKFVSAVAHFSTGLQKDERVSHEQRSEIVKCAAWANVP